jgi:hypothetical protein
MLENNILKIIKITHTIIWVFFALCIIMIWVLSFLGYYKETLFPITAIFIEILVLIVNGWHCPLTKLATKYTTQRTSNFDIYLPHWLAKYNMVIFGSLFLGAIIFTLFRLAGWL